MMTLLDCCSARSLDYTSKCVKCILNSHKSLSVPYEKMDKND
ncbi:unnamed protein product [Chondrus crispus]|uniref:Uncharacterized protein n=1 Tax=Chondrus crispus TaxID=2769 RepID=R7QEY4_CHOCR|nr:unnamed protein product [Chondrus crispus]CDF35991.1 unnamed protein product [Chondrus crispus]|eukprot:XP_005715810.1 unnamed protein product [Chondrus crispus]